MILIFCWNRNNCFVFLKVLIRNRWCLWCNRIFLSHDKKSIAVFTKVITGAGNLNQSNDPSVKLFSKILSCKTFVHGNLDHNEGLALGELVMWYIQLWMRVTAQDYFLNCRCFSWIRGINQITFERNFKSDSRWYMGIYLQRAVYRTFHSFLKWQWRHIWRCRWSRILSDFMCFGAVLHGYNHERGEMRLESKEDIDPF